MSESNHTPGPWRIGDAGRTVFGPPSGNPSPETVATCRNKANARLIAQAPAMLEAIKRGEQMTTYLLAALDAGQVFRLGLDGTEWQAFVNDARAILRAVKGESK